MITPQDLGLPPKFAEYRPGQFEIAAKMAASEKYIYMLDAPTGIGKSLIAATVQKMFEHPVTYLSVTKQLQEQLLADFPEARTMKGRSNYQCLKFPKLFPRVSADDCSDREASPCPNKNACPYAVAKKQALSAPISVLNTAYFLSEANFVGGFSGRKLLVIDEFDTTESALMSFIEVTITQKIIDELGLPTPKFKTKFESWVEWANIAISKLQPQYLTLKMQIESDEKSAWSTVDTHMLREYKTLERLIVKLRFFVKYVNDTWVWYPGEDTWIFKPTWIGHYAKEYLWSHADRVIGMSATILDYAQRAKDLGLEINSVAYTALNSPFPKEHRPVYVEEVANVVRAEMNTALPALATRINDIATKDHPNSKILIHCVSYEILNYLKDRLPKGRVMVHNTFNRSEVLDTFKQSPQPKILLSPSMDRGVDLPGDQCRAVIIAKLPYPYLGDPQVSRRVYSAKDGDRWYALQTISKVVQMSGRGVRSSDDFADTYILDKQFNKLFAQWSTMFPRWWKESIIRK